MLIHDTAMDTSTLWIQQDPLNKICFGQKRTKCQKLALWTKNGILNSCRNRREIGQMIAKNLSKLFCICSSSSGDDTSHISWCREELHYNCHTSIAIWKLQRLCTTAALSFFKVTLQTPSELDLFEVVNVSCSKHLLYFIAKFDKHLEINKFMSVWKLNTHHHPGKIQTKIKNLD